MTWLSGDVFEQYPNSTIIIQIDAHSFFFRRESRDNIDINNSPKQKFEMIVHNECIINYGAYADDLRTKLMNNFLPFISLIPTNINEYFNFNTLDIIIKFEQPIEKLKGNCVNDNNSDATSSNNESKYMNEQPWFIFNILVPFSAKQFEEGELIDNHLMQIKFGANSLIKISILWMTFELEEGDCTTIDLSLTPCNISIRKSDINF